MAIRENMNEEKQNQLRWQVKLGDDAAAFELQAKVLEDRIVDWKIYKVGTVMLIYELAVYTRIKSENFMPNFDTKSVWGWSV